MGKNPAFQFYPNDWLGDNQLQMASTATKGVWIQFLCRMWWAEERGKLSGTKQQLCQLSGCTPAELEMFLTENSLLNFACVTEHDKIVTIINRRMSREEEARKSNASRQAKFRNARNNATVTPTSPSPSTPSTPPSKKDPSDLGDEVQAFLNLWNEIARTTHGNGLPGFHLCQDITGTRRKKVLCRLKEAELSWHKETLLRLTKSTFACGGAKPTPEHPKPFRLSIDWYVDNDTNCVKASEGLYDN